MNGDIKFGIVSAIILISMFLIVIGIAMGSRSAQFNIEVICNHGVISYSENTPVIVNGNYLSCKGLE